MVFGRKKEIGVFSKHIVAYMMGPHLHVQFTNWIISSLNRHNDVSDKENKS